jgi:hypothetical protein
MTELPSSRVRGFFLYFQLGFFVIIKYSKRQVGILINITYYFLKKKRG